MKETIAVNDFKKLINRWRKMKISDFNIAKLIDIYLGIPAYMNQDGMYPVENLYDMSIGLKFKNLGCMLEAVKNCGTFILVKGDNPYGLLGFYTPLRHEGKSENLSRKETENLSENQKSDKLYINYNPSGSPFGNFAEKSQDFSADKIIGPAADEKAAERKAEAEKFFHLINQDEGQRLHYLLSLINNFEQEEHVERSLAREMVVTLVNEILIPHFASQERFMRTTHPGRLRWLENLLKTETGKKMKTAAARRTQDKVQQRVLESRKNKQKNRPICEFEWMDPETGTRFYEDSIEGSVKIPQEAPPRPSEEAIWNVLSRKWNERDE